jgi:hypothetical protein
MAEALDLIYEKVGRQTQPMKKGKIAEVLDLNLNEVEVLSPTY